MFLAENYDVVTASMTPRGVEHPVNAEKAFSVFMVTASMTPRGVEHSALVVRSMIGASGDRFNDAARR